MVLEEQLTGLHHTEAAIFWPKPEMEMYL